MNSRSHIQSELMELNSSLPFNVKEPVFDVPEGYFENFAAGVLAKIKGKLTDSVTGEVAEISPLLAGLSRKMPYSLPENYFEQAATELPGLIKDDSLPEILSSAGKSMPYRVPTGYFEHLPEQVAARVAAPKARVVQMHPRRRWTQFAVAAIMAGVIVLSGVYFFKTKPIDPNSQPEAWVAKKLKNVSFQELEEFIETTPAGINGTETANNSVSGDVKELLQDVSVNELDNFLSQVPGDNEELQIIN